MIRRIAGMVFRPRATLAAVIDRPAWAAMWLLILVVWAASGGWLLSTDIGQQALVDERVRVIETFGGTVDDTQYAAWLANPPWWVYFTSGGRLLLTPAVTILVAIVLWTLARADGASATFSQGLAIAVHASLILLIGQLIATPIHFVRESLTSPLNAAAILPLMEEGTLPTRFFGAFDLFALWWGVLLVLGLSIVTQHRLARYAMPLAAVYVGFAAVVAAVIAVTGGS